MNHESRLLRSTNAERRIALMRRDSGVNRVPWSTGRRIPPIRGREASRRPASRWHGARRRRPLPRAARGDPRRHHRDDDRLRDRRAVRDAARARPGGTSPETVECPDRGRCVVALRSRWRSDTGRRPADALFAASIGLRLQGTGRFASVPVNAAGQAARSWSGSGHSLRSGRAQPWPGPLPSPARRRGSPRSSARLRPRRRADPIA